MFLTINQYCNRFMHVVQRSCRFLPFYSSHCFAKLINYNLTSFFFFFWLIVSFSLDAIKHHASVTGVCILFNLHKFIVVEKKTYPCIHNLRGNTLIEWPRNAENAFCMIVNVIIYQAIVCTWLCSIPQPQYSVLCFCLYNVTRCISSVAWEVISSIVIIPDCGSRF